MVWPYYEQFHNEIVTAAPPTPDREDALLDFVATPYHAERVFAFGSCLALDSFLYTLTILPLRALYSLCERHWDIDVIQMIVIGISFRVLQGVNTSKVYHAVRGQAGITMFVLYSMMEVCDKFFCLVGHEFSTCLRSERTRRSKRRTLVYSLATLIYTISHSFVLMWELVTLNLAVNSYSNALLAFMLSNQFSEIKSALFKRFDTGSLFQLTCADLTQRFQFASLLSVIVLRNFWEVMSKGQSVFTNANMSKCAGPASLIMAAVLLADWLKISYIVNFNNIASESTFSGFLQQLKEDYAARKSGREGHSLVSKQTELPVAPLVIVCVRMFAKGGVIVSPVTPVVFVALLLIKLQLGSWLYQATASSLPKDSKVEASTPKESVDK